REPARGGPETRPQSQAVGLPGRHARNPHPADAELQAGAGPGPQGARRVAETLGCLRPPRGSELNQRNGTMISPATESMTVPEAAERLGISRTTAYQEIAAGRLPCRRLGPKGGKIRVG